MPADRQGVITAELEERLREVGGAARMDNGWLAWCPEKLKWIGLRLLEEAEVRRRVAYVYSKKHLIYFRRLLESPDLRRCEQREAI